MSYNRNTKILSIQTSAGKILIIRLYADKFTYPFYNVELPSGWGSHLLFQRYLPNPGVEPGSPVMQADYLLSEPPGKSILSLLPKFIFHGCLLSQHKLKAT